MKNLIIATILFTTLLSSAGAQDLQQAQATAKATHKNILLRFSGSDWCIPCIRMDKEVFEKTTFQDFAQKKLVVVQADFPRLKKNQPAKAVQQQNEALAAQYNKKGVFPLTVLLDENGNVLKAWEGDAVHTPDVLIQQIEGVLHAN